MSSCRFDAADQDLAEEQVKSAVAVKPSGQVKQWVAEVLQVVQVGSQPLHIPMTVSL